MSVLVVAAHPDDEVLGCGGTIARLANEGRRVDIAIFGEGITSRHARREDADFAHVAALTAATREVAALLGATSVRSLGLPDNRFDTLPLLDVVKQVESLVEDLQPEIIFTHHGGDLNIDHTTLFRAVMTATRPTAGHPVKTVFAFEVASSTEWAFHHLQPAFHPNVFFDVAATMERKLAAMALYEGEARPFPHPRSPEALLAQARRWGSAAGVMAAEAFVLVREIR